jgi:hypothetical protein
VVGEPMITQRASNQPPLARSAASFPSTLNIFFSALVFLVQNSMSPAHDASEGRVITCLTERELVSLDAVQMVIIHDYPFWWR